MRVLNLTVLSLLWIVAGAGAAAQSEPGFNTKSRLRIILIHWDNDNITGSYIKVKNNPNYESIYNVTVDSVYNDPTAGATSDGIGTLSVQLTVRHQPSGVGVIPFQWPKDIIGTKVNITVVETPSSNKIIPDSLRVKEASLPDSLSVHTTESAPNAAGIFYPRDHQNANISMIRLGEAWHAVWDNNEENWLVNVSNPQQVQVIEITPFATKLFCFVCKMGLTSNLSAYTLTLYSETESYTYSLLSMVPDGLGVVKQEHKETAEVLNYTLSFNMSQAGHVYSYLVSSGPLSSIASQKAAKYNDLLVDGPGYNDLYLNEIHFPRLQTVRKEDMEYWIELIGPANTSLSSYCLVISRYTPGDGKTEYSACIRPEDEALTSNKGYYIWNINASTNASQSYLLKMNSTEYGILLYREDQVSYKFLDGLQFIFIEGIEDNSIPGGSCSGSKDHYCFDRDSSNACNTLCLTTKLVMGTRETGVSRCGIQKDPALKKKGVAMEAWSIKGATKKAWNKCTPPKGLLKQISIAESKVTVSTMSDCGTLTDEECHLPNMGLMLMFWNKRSHQPDIGHIILSGADLTINNSVSSGYPLRQMTITLVKTGEPDASNGSAGEITANGASLSSLSSMNVYALALVQHYAFLPEFNISAQQDQVVDAVVYSLAQTDLDISVITKFMAMGAAEEQGQIRFTKSLNPILFHQRELQRNTDSWSGLAEGGTAYTLDKTYVTQTAQKYIRISRIGNNNNPYVELMLPELPEQIKEVFQSGVPLDDLCLVVSVFAYIQRAVKITSTQQWFPADDKKLAIGGVVRWNLKNVGTGNQPFRFGDGDSFVTLFRELNSSDFCMKSFDIYDSPINGSAPMTDEGVLVDYMGLSYNTAGEAIDSVPINDTVEAVRCNSNVPYFNAAFSVVDAGSDCPVPNHLYMYKLCHDRIGIASELQDYAPFPTDYLYIYKLDAHNKIVYIMQGFKYPVLKHKHNVAFIGNIGISPTDIMSFGLGWFPAGAPRINDVVSNNTLSVIVIYPVEKQKDTADTRLSSILETAEDHVKASRPAVYFKPSASDMRHCLLGCDRTGELTDVISYKRDALGVEDSLCADNYTALYEHVRINEINSNTPGFPDIGEYIELKGQPNFQYAGGLSIAMLQVDKGEVIYRYVIHINGSDKVFDENGFFIFEHVVSSNPRSSQAAAHLRFIPNVVGAVALLWGARLVPDIQASNAVTDDHVRMRDLFLDVVVYAKDLNHSRSSDATTLKSKFAMAEPQKIQGQIAIEKSRRPNTTETISRCFCQEAWNMDCFEMSFKETKRQKNSCPMTFRKTVELCIKSVESDIGIYETIRTYIGKLVTLNSGCRNTSCLFSKYQVRDVSHCIPDKFSGMNIQRWTFSVGFPTQTQFSTLSPIVTAERLGSQYPELHIVSCDDAQCPNPKSATVHAPAVSPELPSKGKHAGMIAGIVVAVLVLIIVVVSVVLLVKRRQKRLRNMSARFEANTDNGDEDDDTFLPDGRISFSNPWYNQTNGAAASNGNTKKEYQKLSQT